MATLIPRANSKGEISWQIKFYYRGKPYKTSLGKTHETKAKRVRTLTKQRLQEVKNGLMPPPPEGACIKDYFVRSQVVFPSESNGSANESIPSYLELRESFLNVEKGRIAGSTHYTKTIHLKNFGGFLGKRARSPVTSFRLKDIEELVKFDNGPGANGEDVMSTRTFDNPDRYSFDEHGSLQPAPSITFCLDRTTAEVDMLMGYVLNNFDGTEAPARRNVEALLFSVLAELRDARSLADMLDNPKEKASR